MPPISAARAYTSCIPSVALRQVSHFRKSRLRNSSASGSELGMFEINAAYPTTLFS